MRKKICLILVLLIALSWSMALGEENMLNNPSFEKLSQNGDALSWTQDAWNNNKGITYYVTETTDAQDGDVCMYIENASGNDARVIQPVAVDPNTCYCFSGWVRAEKCDEGLVGANLSVMGCSEEFASLLDTEGQWVEMRVYFKTDAEQKIVKVAARLGGYNNETVGRAWFDNLSMVRVEEKDIPEGYPLFFLEEETTPTLENDTDVVSNIPSAGKILAVAGLTLILLMMGLNGLKQLRPSLRILCVLIPAAIIRAVLSSSTMGYSVDVQCFYVWAANAFENGPAHFYSAVSFCDYPPGYMFMLYPIGALIKLLNLTEPCTPEVLFVIKLIPCVMDLLAVWILYRISGKKILLPVLYAILPAVWIDSAVWGQVDSVLALGILLSFWFAEERNWRAAFPSFILTILMKPQGLIAAPIGLVILVRDLIEEPKTYKKMLQGLGIAVLCGAVLVLPFSWGRPVEWLWNQYASTLKSYPYAVLNTMNVWFALGLNWTSLETEWLGVPLNTLGIIMTGLAVLVPTWFAIREKNRKRLPLIGALIYICVYLLATKVHERYLFPALILLAYSYILERDWRVLVSMIGFSLTLAANCALVLKCQPNTDLWSYLLSDVNWVYLLTGINMVLMGITLWAAVDKTSKTFKKRAKVCNPVQKVDSSYSDFFTEKPAHVTRRDTILMLALTAVYAVVAFVGLGSTSAPQTLWMSTGDDEQIVFDLGEEKDFSIMYYGGITKQNFMVQTSDDGENWTIGDAAELGEGLCFRWKYVTEATYDSYGEPYSYLDNPLVFHGRYVRLNAAGPGLELFEVVFRGEDNLPIPVVSVTETGAREENGYDPELLCDESDTMPDKPSYMNGTYFDEIYHARTGYEHANGLYTYEWTHPPLGKVFIMLGIKIFGMTPFGWRFFGALAGVLMVPAMYMLGLVLFKKTRWACLSSFVMTFDMMHLTQTRIATVDSYAVLFIMLMYLFMFIYMQTDVFREKKRALINLCLSGLFMGLGCASKWICMYAGIGLAVLFVLKQIHIYKDWKVRRQQDERIASAYMTTLLQTLGCCVVFFLIIPALIYYYSYWWQYVYEGGLTFERFWNTQKGMFSYHSQLVDDHPFKSPWYEWPLCLKPMYYYAGRFFAGEGMTSTIMCMGNPAVWWIGFLAVIFAIVRLVVCVAHRKAPDGVMLVLLLSLAAQFLPWVLVPRSTFIYHYFASLPFVFLLLVEAFRKLKLRLSWQIAYMAIVLVMFIGFYPFATGIEFPRVWADAMNWLKFLKLPGAKYKGWLYY